MDTEYSIPEREWQAERTFLRGEEFEKKFPGVILQGSFSVSGKIFFCPETGFSHKKGVWKMGKIKKIKKFSLKWWKIRYLCAILTTLSTQMCPVLMGADAGKTLPKPAWQLEKELAGVEKKLAEVTNEKERLEMEVRTLRNENSLARRELIETIDKYSMLAGKLKRWDLSVAAVMETLRPHYVDLRAEDTAESLRTVMQSSAALASSVSSLCEEVLSLLEQREITSVRAAKIRVMINNLKNDIRSVERYQKTSSFPQGTDTCRILNTDDKLKAAVFSSGHRSGFRAGMILRTEDGSAKFQVVLLKEFTSVGLLVSGDLRSVSIGTRVITTSEKTAK